MCYHQTWISPKGNFTALIKWEGRDEFWEINVSKGVQREADTEAMKRKERESKETKRVCEIAKKRKRE